MKKQKNLFLTGLIYVILFAVYNLLVFVIFRNHSSVFWLSYGFATLAFIVQIASMRIAFKRMDVETVFFGIPLASFSIYYLIAALCVATLFMLFQIAGTTIAFVVQIIILAVYAIIAIIALMTRDAVIDVIDNVKENVVQLKSVRVDIDMLYESCTVPELKESLRTLAETIKYSDPMVNDSVADLDQRIHQKVSELRIYFNNNRSDEAKTICSSLELLYIERNKRLLISK